MLTGLTDSCSISLDWFECADLAVRLGQRLQVSWSVLVQESGLERH